MVMKKDRRRWAFRESGGKDESEDCGVKFKYCRRNITHTHTHTLRIIWPHLSPFLPHSCFIFLLFFLKLFLSLLLLYTTTNRTAAVYNTTTLSVRGRSKVIVYLLDEKGGELSNGPLIIGHHTRYIYYTFWYLCYVLYF